MKGLSLVKSFLVVGFALISGSVFAQTGAVNSDSAYWALGSGLAMGLGAIGGTLSIGIAASAALGGIARNPGSKNEVFTPMVLVLALIEFQAIMAFIIAVLWFTKKFSSL